MKNVFVIWKDVQDGMWHPIAKLTTNQESYQFGYTKGAKHKNFSPFPRMDNLNKTYHSNTLFSFFTNRLIPANRPEFKMMLDWSDINIEDYNELDLLGTSGGARNTDQFRIISEPEKTTNNEYKIKFFIHGIHYSSPESLKRIETLKENETLKFIYEESNPYDSKAILVSSLDETPIGYCPRYLNCDIRTLLKTPTETVHTLKVLKVNINAPSQFKVLCEFTTKWPDEFKTITADEYTLLA